MEGSAVNLLGKDSQIRLPDPDEIIDIGHAIYTADDADAGYHYKRVAQRQVEQFLALRAKPNTPEEPYLLAMEGVARGYAGDLRRAKIAKELGVERATKRYSDRKQQGRDGSLVKQSISTAFRYIGPLIFYGILAGLGYLFALVIGESVSTDLSDKTGTTGPALIASGFFILVGRYFSTLLNNRKEDQNSLKYDDEYFETENSYDQAVETAMQFWRARGREEWKQYTGEDYPEKGSYLMVLESNMNARKRRRDQDRLHDKSDVERLVEGCVKITRIIADKCSPRRRKATAKADVE